MGRPLWAGCLVLVGCGGIVLADGVAPSEAGGRPDATDHDAAVDGTSLVSDAQDENVGALDSSGGGADARADAADARTEASICLPPLLLCGNNCVDVLTDPKNCGLCGSACLCPGDGGVCANGMCACECGPGYAVCNGSCVDLHTDPDNCGQCGNACPSGCCAGGFCLLDCMADEIICGSPSQCGCVDPMTDPVYCGASGHCQGINAGTACTPGEICSSGTCVLRDAAPD
jgi:hypothetical protein